jgi:hypothetical protein
MPDLHALTLYRRAQLEKAEDVTERMVTWLRVQAAEVGSGTPVTLAVADGGLA